MNDWLRAIEQLGLVQAVKSSFYAYPIINAAHILGVGALVTCVILMDLRLLGRFRQVPEQPLVGLLRNVALGAFALAATTGAIMFSIRASDYAAMPLYWAKMGLVLLAGLNFLAFTVLDRRQSAAAISGTARASAILSILLWLSVLLAGRFLGFV